MNFLIELIGWYGTIAIVLAYFLNSFGKLSYNSIYYQILNFTGALGIVVISVLKSAWQPAVLNLIWAVIGVIAIIKIIKK